MQPVSNSSVLIGLSLIKQLSLLKARFADGIIVPDAVWEEVVITGKGRVGAEEIKLLPWIRVASVKNRNLVNLLYADLDRGEAEAIALAQEINSEFLLLDEREARQVALKLGLKVLGTVGILIWAKRNQKIPQLRPQLDLLMTKGQFRIGREVYQEALRLAGE